MRSGSLTRNLTLGGISSSQLNPFYVLIIKMTECNKNTENQTRGKIMLFIDDPISSDEEKIIHSGYVLDFNDDEVLKMDEEYESGEDTQSRSSSIDLNNFLQIKQVKWDLKLYYFSICD